MKKVFEAICSRLFQQLEADEYLTISAGGETSQFIRFNGSKIRQSGLVVDSEISLDYIKNSRTAQSSMAFTGETETDYREIRAVLETMRLEAAQLPEDPYVVLPENKGSSDEDHPGSLLPVDEAADALLPAMQGVDLAGIWASGSIFRANANSTGQKHWFSTETFSLDYSLITEDERMVKATYAGSKWNQADYEQFMADSISKLKLMERKPRKIEPGHYRTFIASAGVADLLNMLSWGGVSEASIQQGDSALMKMRNENMTLSPLFSLTEDFSSGSVPRFNGIGEMAPEVLPLIKKGQLVNTLVSTRTAKEYGCESNNAGSSEGFRAPEMAGGDMPESEILKMLGTGVYLSNLHYLNWSDQIGGRVTGMTRYACFWVENGEIVAPIENMRFDDSIYNFFGSNLEAVSRRTDMIPEVGTYDGRELGGTVCPGILLKSFALTL